jgi:chorismate synthase
MTTWGESHGKAIGVVIDGCPAGLEITEEEINAALAQRAPGKNVFVTPRCEPDLALIYSGVFDGKTTGTPISILIFNRDADSSKYETIKNHLRPGHAQFAYLGKYGLFDHRGGGRASARETACRVAAGAIAKKLIEHFSIQVIAFLDSIANIDTTIPLLGMASLRTLVDANPIFCPDAEAAERMMQKIEETKAGGDSLGGTVRFIATGLPVGLGDPIYEKLEATLAKAMMSLPASKGFEIGEGFHASKMTGSSHNDFFVKMNDHVPMASNHAGGTLGGISTGMPLCGRVAFKPTSSIKLPQETLDLQGAPVIFQLPENSRHDPCVAIRAVPVVEARVARVLADALLLNRSARLE